MPIPPNNPTNPGGSAWDAAREAMAAVTAAGGGAVDLIGIAQRWGVAVDQMIGAMSQLTTAEGRAAREVEQLSARAGYARTPEGRQRMSQAAGYRGELSAARASAAEPMGPPRALFRQQERAESRAARADDREDREAAAARRFAARVGEGEESKAARAAGREDREAAAARRAGARIREQEESRAARQAERAERATPAYRAQSQLSRLRAQADYGRTPEGRDLLREQGALRRELSAQRKQAEPQQSALERLVAKPKAALYAAGAGTLAFSRIARTVEAGSPGTYSTYEGSKELLKARVGGDVAPGLDVVSAALQDAAKAYMLIPDSVRTGMWSGGLGASRAMQPEFRNLGIGLQAQSFGGEGGGGAAYYEQFQQAALQGSADQLDAEVFRVQMENLQRTVGGLLERVADNTEDLKRVTPAFRP